MKHRMLGFDSLQTATVVLPLARFLAGRPLPFKARDPSGCKSNEGTNALWCSRSWIMACVAAVALQASTFSIALGEAPASGQQIKGAGLIKDSCRPSRFLRQPHYVRVRMNGDRIASIHLHRTGDDEEVVTSYPFGVIAAISTPDTREQCMRVGRLERFVERIERRQQRTLARQERKERRQAPSLPAPDTTTPDFNTGLLIGWNDSTGQTSGQCYNFTTSAPANNVGSLSFSSENAASSVAAQTKVSATVSGGFGAFSTSAKFSYSDQWESSHNSGSAYFNISSIYTLDNTVDSGNPLTMQGQNAGDQFATLCGTRYMASVPGGMVATIAVSYGSSSETAKSDIDASFTASFELDSLKAAVNAANQTSDSSSYFNVRHAHSGGGAAASAALTAQFGATNSDGDAYVDLCANGDVDACDMFVSNMSTGAINAGNAFNTLAQDPAPGADLNFFNLFPNGVAGVETTALGTETAVTEDDALAPYQAELEQYLTLLNEIATLNNRTGHLSKWVGEPSFNPITILDLQSNYFSRLLDANLTAASYANDRNTLVDNLGNCLSATSSNVTTVCAPIIDNTIDSAYAWYDATNGNPNCTSGSHTAGCWLAQQNTIALQYTALFEFSGINDVTEMLQFPKDVLYIDQLPLFTDSPGAPIGGKAALTTFADTPYSFPFGANIILEVEEAWVDFLPLNEGADLSEFITANDPSLTYFGIFGPPLEWFVLTGSTLTWTGLTDCHPSFTGPCGIGYETDQSEVSALSVTMTQIPDLFTAD